jgi:hypothetical protein
MLEEPQNGTWQRLHFPAISACELTPPSGAPSRALFDPAPPKGLPVRALSAPGLSIIPPDASANPPTISTVRIAAMIPEAVKKPN